jgi:benzoate-CoA ligase
VPLSEIWRPNDLRALIADAGARLAVVEQTLAPALEEVHSHLPALETVIALGLPLVDELDYADLREQASPTAGYEDLDLEDPALLLYSAGGGDMAPKGIAHSHGTPVKAFTAYARDVLGLTDQDKVFSSVKLTSAYGLGAGFFFPLCAGAQSFLLPDRPRPMRIFEVLEVFRPSVFFATPSLYGMMLHDFDVAGGSVAKTVFQSVRRCVSGAEALPARLMERFKEKFGVELLDGMGLTEAFHFVLSNQPGAARPGSSGRVLPGFEARVVGEDGKPLGPTEIGALEVRGPTVAKRYWGRGDDGQTFRSDGWVHTHDRFFTDQDGFFFHCGRTDDLFKVGGKWVSPIEVEQTLLAHPAVWECAVVPAEDEDGLVKPLAYVVPNVGHTPGPQLAKDLMEFVKREIAPYKYPRWIDFVEALPKSAGGKLLRFKLRQVGRRQPTRPLP